MRRTLRLNAMVLFVAGLAFALFFQATKHSPRLAAVNPFAEDPYDSVGSFAVQFVLFMILVSLFRAFQRGQPDSDSAATQIRGQLMAHLAIAFTLVGDLISLLRHLPMWVASPAGRELVSLTTCFLLSTLAVIVLLLATTHLLTLRALRGSLIRIVVSPACAVLVLACYPERLRRSLPGEILTVLCGIALLFLVVWAVGSAFTVQTAAHGLTQPSAIAQRTGGEPTRSIAVRLTHWTRPRFHRWLIVAAGGILCGAFLVFQELNEGGNSPHGAKRLLVVAVYLGLETAGVVTGYALLSRQLALFPRE
jgi:hypothetical protein